MVLKIKKKVLTNKANGHKYVVIPSFLDVEEGDYVILSSKDNKIISQVWRKNTSLVATIPKKYNFSEVTIDKIEIIGGEK